MPVFFGFFGLFSIVRLAIYLALIIYLFIWLREKTYRDQTVSELLGQIQDDLVDIASTLESRPRAVSKPVPVKQSASAEEPR